MNPAMKSMLFTLSLGVTLTPHYCLSTSTIEQRNFYVRDFNDFQLYVDTHKERVIILGMILFHAHPERYHELTKADVAQFLALHDKSKLLKTNAQSLYEFYGQNQKFMSQSQRDQFHAIVDQINKYDTRNAKLYFETRRLSSKQMNLLLEIEKIADIVDRGMDPVAHEDFESKGLYKMKLGSEFLETEFSRKAAQYLESIYQDSTKDFSFFKRKLNGRFSCNGLF
ncbi:MAG: hypothetical protein BroJett040_11020 [Oligoflexia bacterium]|nr:MAG: hypothetical protein BroJett040_11020 [Oligoflexia bacterium]